MAVRNQFIQVRVTHEQKAALRQLAKRANQDLSSYILDRSLAPQSARFAKLLDSLRIDPNPAFALAALSDFLGELPAGQIDDATAHADLSRIPPLLQNYVAAMVEQACVVKRIAPPAWTREVAPLDEPYFAGGLKTLRPYLLSVSPVAFKRRNLFVDSSVGRRV